MEGLSDRGARPVQDYDVADARVHPRFLIHVLPKGLHRIRHYGLFANGKYRAANIAHVRQLLTVTPSAAQPNIDSAAESDQPRALPTPCPQCGGRLIIIETFARGCQPKHTPTTIRIDTS
jgi:hypothetical protein